MKVVVYPRMINAGNPYINDFVNALEATGIEIENQPHRNPFMSLLFLKQESEIYFFHWIENLPLYKYGLLQFVIAILYIFLLKQAGKKVVWFLHNKKVHTGNNRRFTDFMMRYITKQSDLIITHAKEGVEFINNIYPSAAHKVFFLHHPTKKRMDTNQNSFMEVCYDLIIWGTITPYKRIPEFLEYLQGSRKEWKVKIVGRCASESLKKRLLNALTDYTEYEDRNFSFQELKELLPSTRFILIPYASDSILSSGILMDSLSYGCRVIGPNVGSFRDYADMPELQVAVFNNFEDINSLLKVKEPLVNQEGYIRFLEENSWPSFAEKIMELINTKLFSTKTVF